jgi:hypothetical protein
LLRNSPSERDIYLYDGNIAPLFTKNIVGCLSGAGGAAVNGILGPGKTFCGVNAAFTGPDMVPNPLYSREMIASFDSSIPPNLEYKPALVNWSAYLPKPELGIATSNANPILL